MPSPKEPRYVSTWDELSKRLGVSRRALQEWRRNPRYQDYPRDRPDGRKEIPVWRAFMVEHGLKRADTFVNSSEPFAANDHPEPGDDEPGIITPPRIAGSQADWQKAVLHEKHAIAHVDRLTHEGTLLIAADLETPLGATLASIQVKLTQFPARAARRVAGLRDVGECEDTLRDEMDAVLADIGAAKYVDASVQEIVRRIPFDPESERLFALVTFDGQDRSALLDLIARVASEALRAVGSGAIARALRTAEDADIEIAHPVTGQVTPQAEEAGNSNRALACASATETGERGPSAHSSTGDSASLSRSEVGVESPVKRVRKKSRPKPAPPPGKIEASIHEAPRKKRRRS